MPVRETAEIKADIIKLKSSTGTAVYAHSYQEPDILDIADCVGDTVELAAAAMKSEYTRIVVCGVYFTAEAIKLLCPEKQIILANSQARCPMAGKVFPGRVQDFRAENPQVRCVCDISLSLAVKAECELCVTADTAMRALTATDWDDILFIGDCNLAKHLANGMPQKNIRAWPCRCPVLSSVETRDIALARQRWQDVLVLANSSCPREVAEMADMVGSTSDIVRRCEEADSEQEIAIADEISVCRALLRRWPERNIHQIAASKLVCNMMKMTTPETAERAIKGSGGLEVTLDGGFAPKAASSLLRLLELIG